MINSAKTKEIFQKTATKTFKNGIWMFLETFWRFYELAILPINLFLWCISMPDSVGYWQMELKKTFSINFNIML